MLPVTSSEPRRGGSTAGLMLLIVVAGLLLPVLPRVVVPRLLPGVYSDGYEHLSDFGTPDVVLCLWTATPFVFMAFAARAGMRSGDPAERRASLAGVITTIVVFYALGIFLFMPGPPRGATCVHLAFPLFACILAPMVDVGGGFLARLWKRAQPPEETP